MINIEFCGKLKFLAIIEIEFSINFDWILRKCEITMKNNTNSCWCEPRHYRNLAPGILDATSADTDICMTIVSLALRMIGWVEWREKIRRILNSPHWIVQ